MKRNLQATIILVIIFVVLNITSYLFIDLNKEQRIQKSLESHLDKLQTHYEVLLHHQKIRAFSAYKSTISNKKVIEILSKIENSDLKQINILRTQLYELLKTKYNILKTEGVLQYHFVLPDNKVFLRVHKPDKYGDSLTNIRADFEYVHKTKKEISGFTQGKTSHGFRNVYPIFDNNGKYISAMEVSYGSEVLQNNFTEISKIHTHFLVDKHIFNAKAWSREDILLKYLPSSEHTDYLITMTNHHSKKVCIDENHRRLLNIKRQIKNNISKQKEFSVYTRYQNKIAVISFYPIKDLKDNKIAAWIVSYEDDEFILSVLNGSIFLKMLSFIISIVFFYFIYKIITQKELLNIQVEEKTKTLANTNKELEILNNTLELKVEDALDSLKKQHKLHQIETINNTKFSVIGKMSAGITHEINTPLTYIKGNFEMLGYDIDDLPSSDIKSRMIQDKEKITEGINRIANIVEAMREMSQVSKESKEKVNIYHTIVMSLTMAFNHSKLITNIYINNKQFDINIQKDNYEFTSYLQKQRIEQAWIIIINNALDELVKIENFDTRKLNITIKNENNFIVVSFIDNAGGIKDDIINNIFEPFISNKDSSGMGVGLNIAKKIIEDQGGTIEVSNYINKDEVYNKGANFTIKLPSC